jgi:2-polyprenyl-6-methoxyphenol hydroxylase-like FAD-dependent oxidoreductase
MRASAIASERFKAAVSRRFAGYAHSVSEIIAQTTPEAILFHKLYDRDPIGRFHEGRVCLLGDAAHPTTPNLGQGAAMAIESAIVLSRCLNGSADVEQSFSAYERVRSPRTRGVTTTSRRLGRVAQLENGFLRSLRNLFVRLTPKSVQLKQLRTLVDYDAASVALPI